MYLPLLETTKDVAATGDPMPSLEEFYGRRGG
jgi:hypothetical protein